MENPVKNQITANLTAPLVVELGRTHFSVLELSQLQSGHIIELNKTVGDPVDLVVGDKMVGKGELIEIEGEIGIRILSLVE